MKERKGIKWKEKAEMKMRHINKIRMNKRNMINIVFRRYSKINVIREVVSI